MPRRATSTSFGAPRGNPRGDPIKAGAVGTEVEMIRARTRRAFGKRILNLEQIADGSITTPTVTKAGVVDLPPSFSERVNAIKALGSFGLPTQQAVDVTSGGQPLTLSDDERAAKLAAIAEALRAR